MRRRVLRAAVRRASDATLERVAGNDFVLRALFGALARRYDPAAPGFSGDIVFALRSRAGAARWWTVTVDHGRATARSGPSASGAPVVTVRTGVADLLRIATGEADPGSALLEGRLDLEGDFAAASLVGSMFGLRSPF